MRTVMYYTPERIALERRVRIDGGHWVELDGTTRSYHQGCYECRWLKGEKGVMTLAQNDLDTLVKHGLVVLGEVCEP